MAIINAAKATVELSQINCGECGGVYAITERRRQQCQDEGAGWFCPYCRCSWGYFGNGRIKELEKQLARSEASHDQTRAALEHTQAERDQVELRRRAEKAAKTRIKNRVANGVCPCCNRSFQDLTRHMKTRHPDFGGES